MRPIDDEQMEEEDWRKGAQELFDESLAIAVDVGILKMSSLDQLYVDTTDQEKNIAYQK